MISMISMILSHKNKGPVGIVVSTWGSLPITSTTGGQLVDGDAKGSIACEAHHGHLGVAHLARHMCSDNFQEKHNLTYHDIPAFKWINQPTICSE